jgi:hypothetical protein
MSLTVPSNQGLLSGDYLSLYRKRVAYGEDPDTIILYLVNLRNNRKTSKEVRPTSSRKLVRLTPENVKKNLVLPPLRGGRAAPALTPLGGWSSERPRVGHGGVWLGWETTAER